MKEQVFKVYEEIFLNAFHGMGIIGNDMLKECKILLSITYEVSLDTVEMLEVNYPMKGLKFYYSRAAQSIDEKERYTLAMLQIQNGFSEMKRFLNKTV
jgi:hypothetical protein